MSGKQAKRTRKADAPKKPMPERPVLVKLTPSQIVFIDRCLASFPLNGLTAANGGQFLMQINTIRIELVKAMPKSGKK